MERSAIFNIAFYQHPVPHGTKTLAIRERLQFETTAINETG
jgi:hypothetical protein